MLTSNKKGQVLKPGLIGGGENRTLVLSKLPINAYMLSVFIVTSALLEGHHTRDQRSSSYLEFSLEEGKKLGDSYQG